MSRGISVVAPCRLHFGLLSFGHRDRPQFGGLGAMIQPPQIRVDIRRAERFSVCGAHIERASQFLREACRQWDLPFPPGCALEIIAPPDHVGLGVGTQLALSVATGLRRLFALGDLAIDQLVASMGRGRRSAIGSHGFQTGGLLLDGGKRSTETLGKLHRRVDLPGDWRFVVLRPLQPRGLAGDIEKRAFERLPPVPEEVAAELWQLAEKEILPAAERADFDTFSDAIYRYGVTAGKLFAPVQGGPFATGQTAALIQRLREQGVAGVGQSSWGPTVFAVQHSDISALELAQKFADKDSLDVIVARPDNRGAVIRSD